MKIRLICKKENYEKFLNDLKSGNFTVTNLDADVIVIERGYKIESIIGKMNEEYKIIMPQEIYYVESYGNEVFCITQQGKYSIREKLYDIESFFNSNGFVRVNKSYVINKNYIKSIKPFYNMKFILTMENNFKIDVTRTYYYVFKEFIGL